MSEYINNKQISHNNEKEFSLRSCVKVVGVVNFDKWYLYLIL